MSIRMSTALQEAVLTNYGLGQLLQLGYILLYDGAVQPASADAAPVGSFLGTITQNGLAPPSVIAPGGGLMVRLGAPGTLMRNGAWIAKGAASGTFGWWRWVAIGSNPNGESTTAYRLDGLASECFNPAEISAITPALNLAIGTFSLTIQN